MKKFKDSEKKPFVIAGLILILALIIAIIWNFFPFYNKLKNSYDGEGITEKVTNEDKTENADATKFNSSFLPYIGDEILDQQVISLISLVNTTNLVNKNHTITWGENSINNIDQVKSTKIYKVTVKYDDQKYIKEINITRLGK